MEKESVGETKDRLKAYLLYITIVNHPSARSTAAFIDKGLM